MPLGVWFIPVKKSQSEVPTLAEGVASPWSTWACRRSHTAPLQANPPLPCPYFPSPVVNCIPLDDITGNERQQQDNKRAEASVHLLHQRLYNPPQLMDVDLYRLFRLPRSIPQSPPPPPPPSFLYSTFLPFRYLRPCD